MFKTLREKINPTDQSQRKKQTNVNNSNSIENENSNDLQKNIENPSLSRFSSLSSLVNDFSTAFSKSMTAPQHIQPYNSGVNLLFDNESISEYDDSVSGGDTFSKEELFQRYKRAQSIAKRYKTRYLEVVESHRQIEADNNKLVQTLTECQDAQIRRVTELKEQIELDKRAKVDVEENYLLMIEEKVELINVLKLQVNLLKEGKDLPPELEEQIKQNHEKAVLFERRKDDEIKELKLVISQRDNLLQRCKDKINSLNSQLNELKMKFSNIQDISISTDTSANPVSNDLTVNLVQNKSEIENREKEYNERMKSLLEFEEKKSNYEAEMLSMLDQRKSEVKLEDQQMKEKIKMLSEENESLSEQVDIKTKIIQDLMKENAEDSYENGNISTLNTSVDKLKLCRLIINRYPDNIESLVDELIKVLNSTELEASSEMSNSYTENNEEFTEQISSLNQNDNSRINDLDDENKFLQSRIEQLEKMKLLGEEENLNREKDLTELNLLFDAERKNYAIKSKSFENEINALQMELQQYKTKDEENLHKLSETQTHLAKNEKQRETLLLEKEVISQKSETLERSLSSIKLEKNNLIQGMQKMSNEYNDLETKLGTISKEYELHKKEFTEKNEECKLLNDRIDELMTSLDNITSEKNQLLTHVNDVQDHISTKEEQLSLNVVEMQQRFDQEILDVKDQLRGSNELNEEKSAQILGLEKQKAELASVIEQLKEDLEIYKHLTKDLDELTKDNADLIREKEKLEQVSANVTEQNENFGKEKEILMQKMESESEILKTTLGEMVSVKGANEQLKNEVDQLRKESEDLNNDLVEVKNTLANEIEEKLSISNNLNNKIKLMESVQTDCDEMRIKQESLIQEIESTNHALVQSQKENDQLVTRYTLLTEENIALTQELEKCKSDLNNMEITMTIDKGLLSSLQKEVEELTTNKLVLENHIRDFESSILLITEERAELAKTLSESSNHVKKVTENVQGETAKILHEYEENIKHHEIIIAKHEGTIEIMQKLMDDKDEAMHEETMVKNGFITKLGIVERYLSLFCTWVEEVTTLENCEGQCDHQTDATPVHWTNDMETECHNFQSLTLAGVSVDKLLLLCHNFHSRLHTTSNVLVESQESLNHLKKVLFDVSSELHLENNDLYGDMHGKLDFIRTSVSILKHELEEKSSLLSQMESQCSQFTQSLVTDGISFVNGGPDESPFCQLKVGINHVIKHYQENLGVKEEINKVLRCEFEAISGKLEKSNNLLFKMFKQLINIFHLADININNVNDINNSVCKRMLKGLKDYIKQREHISNEYEQIKLKFDNTEMELKTAIELNHNIKTELDDLKTSVSNDRDRLIATSEELESSMRRLHEVADEKGRIDEEKQSLRKELKELNEKITNLKLEFEKQSLEKQRLEKQFDESLDKVRLNHSALEEMYKKELDKQHGYQRNLEEQIAIHKQSSSLKLSENENKLETVLNQSEQLLELNHHYKKLLDDTKLEKDSVLSEVTALENQHSQLQSQLDILNSEKKDLTETIENLQRVHNETLSERDHLRNLLTINENKNGDWEVMKQELDNTKMNNENLKMSIKTLENNNEEMAKKERSLLVKSFELSAQEIEYKNNLETLQRKIDDMEIQRHAINIEKNELRSQLNSLQNTHNHLSVQNGEYKNLMTTYKDQIEELNLELEQMKAKYDIEKDDLEQRFSEERSNFEDNFNRQLKKIAKDFDDKISVKERDFQKTFEEALTTIRSDENRIRNDLRATIDEQNRSIIELETDKNQLLDSICENEVAIKNLQKLIESKDNELQSVRIQIEDYASIMAAIENEKEVAKLNKISKMNQTIDTSTCYEELFLDSVGIKDHEVLLMHCSDIEEQLKQLHAENINLKKSATLNIETASPDSVQEPPISSRKAKPAMDQQSLSNDSNKNPIFYHGNIFRSPNLSCSDYNFCPIPITEATDYEYLHDVLLKYMTGLETEILAKVVCTVMKFSYDETNRVLLYEQDRNKFIRRIL